MITIEIIIPIFNSSATIERTLNSIYYASKDFEQYRVICVDDGSQDQSIELAKKFQLKLSNKIHFLNTGGIGLGPGIARNKGINYCKKDSYIIFLDSDDELSDNALKIIYKKIKDYKFPEILAMNFLLNESESKNPLRKKRLNKSNRRDNAKFNLTKNELIKSYLKMQMDGSVIFSIFQSNFLTNKKITFREGLHEDIDFIFNCYLKANKLTFCDYVFYKKNTSTNSIINNFSNNHIKGYLSAWFNIFKIIKDFDAQQELNLQEKEIEDSFLIGFRGAVGVLFKNREWSNIEYDSAVELMVNLIKKNKEIFKLLIAQKKCTFTTEYDKLYEILHDVLIQDGKST